MRFDARGVERSIAYMDIKSSLVFLKRPRVKFKKQIDAIHFSEMEAKRKN